MDTDINIVAFLCYTQALLYNLTCNWMYMCNDDIPKILDTYLKDFKCYETTSIVDCVSVNTCPGLNDNNDSEHNLFRRILYIQDRIHPIHFTVWS